MSDFEHMLAFAPLAIDYVPQMLLLKTAAEEPFTICVDLDGTLAETQKPHDPDKIGPPRQRAIDYVRRFSDAGARIIIYTVRGNHELIEDWLSEHDVAWDFINENPDQPDGSSGKILAHCYWDDRAFNAEDPDEHGPTLLQKAIEHLGDEAAQADESPALVIEKRVTIMFAPELLNAFSPREDS